MRGDADAAAMAWGMLCFEDPFAARPVAPFWAASAVTEAVTRRMGPIRDRVHTCTADNGKEFAGHREISDALGAGFYFATPYHSWERGLNEHTNGLVREYFPKGTDFRKVTEAQVRAVEDRINHRPRKVLGYRTPAEVFAGVPAGP